MKKNRVLKYKAEITFLLSKKHKYSNIAMLLRVKKRINIDGNYLRKIVNSINISSIKLTMDIDKEAALHHEINAVLELARTRRKRASYRSKLDPIRDQLLSVFISCENYQQAYIFAKSKNINISYSTVRNYINKYFKEINIGNS
ncbi:hypothetical protein [Colwellia sp. BRX8-9]|uniref:hypothetical protein n=1 Tax=Colwellia sp. BRX8-9 TaxID=2759831 RepID=UPI0015F5DDF0|nr:hypothetical protein [Colwellia sp. BRX8-9]MBA6350066.1 hypothetical protein [Colwellia sp. BRX8-9]